MTPFELTYSGFIERQEVRDKRLQQLEADNYQEEQTGEDEAYSESDVRGYCIMNAILQNCTSGCYQMSCFYKFACYTCLIHTRLLLAGKFDLIRTKNLIRIAA